MRLVSPVRRLVMLLGWLLLPLSAAAQEPLARPSTPPPDPPLSLPPDPATEPAGDVGRGGVSSLTRVGEWPYGPSYAIAALGEATVSGHGRVLRIETPAGTTPGRQDLLMPGLVRDIATDGARVFVATSSASAGSRGITVVETSPAGSGIAGGVYGRSCVGLVLAGNRLYATVYDPALASYVLLVLDTTTPGLVPAVLGSVPFGGTGGGIATLGTTVYVAAGAAGVVMIDAADPATPAVVGSVAAGSFARRVAVETRGGVSHLAVGSGQYSPLEGSVTVFNLAVPAQPAVVYTRTFASPVEDVLWNPHPGIYSFADLYVAASYNGLYALEDDGEVARNAYVYLANSAPGVTRFAAAPARAQAVLVADYIYGTFAYGDGFIGFDQLSEGTGSALGVDVDSQDPATVYVADGAAGIVRLHAEADGRLVEAGRAHDETWYSARSVAQNATYLFVADGYSGVHVVDKATMARVATLRGSTPYSDVVAVSADGQTLFVRDRRTVTDAYSLADPAYPAFLWERTDLDPATYASAGGVLYVGELAGSNVRVLSLADPANPVQTATRPTDGSNVGVVLGGARLYAAGGPSRVSVFDVAAPAVPVLLGTVTTPSVYSTDVRTNALYVGGANGLAVYDATVPDRPVLLASYDAGRVGTITDVAATATDVFVSEGTVGVERLRADIQVAAEPGTAVGPEALAVRPNPTAGPVVVTFGLAEAGDAEVEVVDVLGRRVRTLAAGAAAGAQRVEWDGCDAAGRPVAAGVYALRVRVGEAVQTRLLTVVR